MRKNSQARTHRPLTHSAQLMVNFINKIQNGLESLSPSLSPLCLLLLFLVIYPARGRHRAAVVWLLQSYTTTSETPTTKQQTKNGIAEHVKTSHRMQVIDARQQLRRQAGTNACADTVEPPRVQRATEIRTRNLFIMPSTRIQVFFFAFFMRFASSSNVLSNGAKNCEQTFFAGRDRSSNGSHSQKCNEKLTNSLKLNPFQAL